MVQKENITNKEKRWLKTGLWKKNNRKFKFIFNKQITKSVKMRERKKQMKTVGTHKQRQTNFATENRSKSVLLN